MKDLHSHIFAASAIGAAVLAATTASAAIDLQAYESAEVILSVGAGGITFTGTHKIEFVLTHSDDDTTYSPVTQQDVLGVTVTGNGVIKALTTAHAAAAVYRAGYKGGRRYLKVSATFSGTHGTGTPLAVSVIKSHGSDNPQINQA